MKPTPVEQIFKQKMTCVGSRALVQNQSSGYPSTRLHMLVPTRSAGGVYLAETENFEQLLEAYGVALMRISLLHNKPLFHFPMNRADIVRASFRRPA